MVNDTPVTTIAPSHAIERDPTHPRPMFTPSLRFILLTILISATRLSLSFAADYTRTTPVEIPADLILFEAESMKTDGKSWRVQPFVRDHIRAGSPSNLQQLAGDTGGPGTATKEITLARDGRYRIWVRYLDVTTATPKDPRWPFRVRASQGGQPVGSKDFDTVGLRLTPETLRKWSWDGDWGFSYVWDSMEADLKAGACVLEMSKLPPIDPGNYRYVDCFVVTSDLKYEPNTRDFATPLYLKVVMSKTGNPENVFLHFDASEVGHHDLTRVGLFPGAMAGYGPERWLRAGDESPWVNIAPILPPMVINAIYSFPSGLNDNVLPFEALTGWIVRAKASDYTLLLSRTPSEEGLIGKFHRSGRGAGLTLLIDMTKPQEAKSEIECSRELLRAVQQLPRTPGRRPREFPLITGIVHDSSRNPGEAIENDLRTLVALGFSGTANSLIDPALLSRHGMKFNSSQATIFFALKDGCFHQANWDAIREAQAANLKNYPPGGVQWIKLMDEVYSMHLEHLAACPVCTEKFKEFVRAKGFPADEAARARLVLDKAADPKLFYYTMLYRAQMLTDFMKRGTAIVRDLNPGVDTLANATTELTYSGNLLMRGTDWFSLYKQQAMTVGFVQDANACTPSQQTVSYTMDVLRSACKYHGQPLGVYNMISREPWDIAAKAFTEIGHGARIIDYYFWGPYHVQNADAQSRRTEVWPVLKEINHAVGAVEKDLLQATPVPSKLALLYSHTTDIWDLQPKDWGNDRKGFGDELMDLYLLLKHLGYPIDILTEDDVIEGRAADYAAVFVTGSHLKDGVLLKLLDWSNAGGFLYFGPGAAEFNQFNQPIKELVSLGLKRQPFKFVQSPGHEDYLPLMQVIAKVSDTERTFHAVGAYQKLANDTKGRVVLRFEDGTPCASVIEHGKGRIVSMGFFAGLSYVREGCIPMSLDRQKRRAEGKPLHTWNPRSYPAEYREFFRALLTPIAWKPPVAISHPLVEGSLLAGPKAYVLALSNWSGDLQKITVSATLPGKLGKPSAVIHSVKDVSVKGHTVRFTMNVERGDFIVIPRKDL